MLYVLNGGRDERTIMSDSALRELYQRLEIEKMLIIPLAIQEKGWQLLWQKNLNFFRKTTFAVKTITVFDTPESAKEKVAWADAIYFPGGSQSTLLDRMNELDLAATISQAMSHLKMLAGGSAGAMVFGEQCLIGHREVTRVVPGLNWLQGSVVDSHFANRNRQARLKAELRKLPGLRGIGIDEDTAACFDDAYELQQVVGPGSVAIYDEDKEQVYDSRSF